MARRRGLLLDSSNHRELPPDYDGDVLLWDIDKTYLDTHFSSFRGLAAIPFELAIDKQSIPGSVPLLRALRRGPGKDNAIVPLYFISGSPPQLRGVIERRMTFDGVDFDGITFKDQLGLILQGRPWRIKEQIGYKLTALLIYRRSVPAAARWLLFGDNVEMDADVFLLFGEVCAGLRGSTLERRLRQHHVHGQDIQNIMRYADALPVTVDPVLAVFIHLARLRDPARFHDPRVVPTLSYLQTALVLHRLGRIRSDAITAVARELRQRGVGEADIQSQIEDAVVRLGVTQDAVALTDAAKP